MFNHFRPISFFAVFLAVMLNSGCGAYHSGGVEQELDSGIVEYSSRGPGLRRTNTLGTDTMIPDGRGGHIWHKGAPQQLPPDATLEAQELRLRVKELAAQMLETRNNAALGGLIALPTSFVNLNDFSESSPFGRYMAEAMYYEFNQRNVPVLEYRLTGKIAMRFQEGEFALARTLPPLSSKQSWAAVLVGTYLKEGGAVFVNVRLVRPVDGMVLRTGQLVFGDNTLVSSLVDPLDDGTPFHSGTLQINPPNQPKPRTK